MRCKNGNARPDTRTGWWAKSWSVSPRMKIDPSQRGGSSARGIITPSDDSFTVVPEPTANLTVFRLAWLESFYIGSFSQLPCRQTSIKTPLISTYVLLLGETIVRWTVGIRTGPSLHRFTASPTHWFFVRGRR
jgi:hypothetical protein